MFREMRRKDRTLSANETEKLLENGTWGVLSVVGDDGYPYGVPVNYGYYNGKIYIHSTPGESHKLDAIRRNDKVCLTVVADNTLLPEDYSTKYASVIVFGRARILEAPAEKMDAMIKMMRRLAPGALDKVKDHCVRASDSYAMIEITPEYITGKSNKKR